MFVCFSCPYSFYHMQMIYFTSKRHIVLPVLMTMKPLLYLMILWMWWSRSYCEQLEWQTCRFHSIGSVKTKSKHTQLSCLRPNRKECVYFARFGDQRAHSNFENSIFGLSLFSDDTWLLGVRAGILCMWYLLYYTHSTLLYTNLIISFINIAQEIKMTVLSTQSIRELPGR